MQSPEELVGSNDQTQMMMMMMMKGKRTKRQRAASSLGLAVTSSSSSGCGGGGGGERGSATDDYYNSVSSPTTTSSEIYDSTEEEEDMANCLIMLAQGTFGSKQIEEDEDGKMRGKFGSTRKFSEIATSTATNKAGFYVYQCKTCNRSFPSFQALGGHRASHKKPKASPEEKKALVLPLKNEPLEEGPFNRAIESPVLALQVSSSNNNIYNKSNCQSSKAKVHECSICGSEFTSGQALGGHMRRHRTVAAAANQPAAAMSVDTSTTVESNNIGEDIKPRNLLELDLNLPAPEDDLHDSKFQFGASQPAALVFSTPALVDCHY